MDVLATGSGYRFVSGMVHPNEDQRAIAIAIVNMWFFLPFTRRVSEIVEFACHDAALHMSPDETCENCNRTRTLNYLYRSIEDGIKSDVQLFTMYVMEKRKIQRPWLPLFADKTFGLESMAASGESLMSAINGIPSLRTQLIHLVFSSFASPYEEWKKFALSEQQKFITAHAVMKLFQKSETSQKIQVQYRQAIWKTLQILEDMPVLSRPRDFNRTADQLFMTLSRVLTNELNLELIHFRNYVIKEYGISRSGN